MSLITAISAVVGLDVLVLALLAYVMRMPFRLTRDHPEHSADVAGSPCTSRETARPRAGLERAGARRQSVGAPTVA